MLPDGTLKIVNEAGPKFRPAVVDDTGNPIEDYEYRASAAHWLRRKVAPG